VMYLSAKCNGIGAEIINNLSRARSRT
jgi:hypothetical protein